MNIRFANPDELAAWDEMVVRNPDGGNVFQSHEIATVKQQSGWATRFLVTDKLAITVLEKSVFGIGKLWYVPKGPGVSSLTELEPLLPVLKQFARDHGAFVVKIEPELLRSDELHADLAHLGLVKTRPIQPNSSTVVLDLTPDLDTILASLNQKGRHAVRRAERDGVIAKAVEFTDKNTQIMYDLMRETATGKWRTRSYAYYYEFWKRFVNKNSGQLFFAYSEGEVVASAFAMYMGLKGTYKDGASTRKRSVYGASHLLQWEVIKWMKQHDVTSYDLCGTPPSEAIIDPTHPHYGLGRFKTSFNKHVTDYIGAYDLIVRPIQYAIWSKLGERATLRIHAARFGEYWY